MSTRRSTYQCQSLSIISIPLGAFGLWFGGSHPSCLKYSNLARVSSQRIGSVQCWYSLGSAAGKPSLPTKAKQHGYVWREWLVEKGVVVIGNRGEGSGSRGDRDRRSRKMRTKKDDSEGEGGRPLKRPFCIECPYSAEKRQLYLEATRQLTGIR